MQRILGVLIIGGTLLLGQAVNSGVVHLGVANADNGTSASPYGPVDQNAPLDFSTQPASVPKNYQPGQLYNIEVLKGYTYPRVLQEMEAYTVALGVGCEYCHNEKNFAYDTKTKIVSRKMISMVANLDSSWITPVHKQFTNYAVTGQVGCVTCHRGQPSIPVEWNVVPVQYLDWPAKTTKQAGFVLNSMYSVSKSLGVNCLFCHNTADFVTLQYYPSNRIAHRMWQMVDAINHQYLPPDVKAVTCYTCHRGAKWPSKLVKAGLDETPVEPVPAHPEVHANPGAHLDPGST